MADVASALQQKIRSSIPLSEAMQFNITSLSANSISVSAPLQPNVNIHGTGFAGSIYSIAVLTGWALCVHIMDELGFDGDLVVASAEIRYRSPVTGDLLCSTATSATERENFASNFISIGKAKLRLQVDVGDDSSAVLHASYVAVSRAKSAV